VCVCICARVYMCVCVYVRVCICAYSLTCFSVYLNCSGAGRSLHKPKFHLARHVTSRLDTTRSTCRARRDERVEPVELVMSSVWSRAVRQARHGQIAWARHVERVVSCRDVTRRAKWNLGYITMEKFS